MVKKIWYLPAKVELLHLHMQAATPHMQLRVTVALLQEHPVLGKPFYMLHPCRTAEVMALLRPSSKPTIADVLRCEEQSAVHRQSLKAGPASVEDMQAYFVAWFSVYGGLLGLALPRGLWPSASKIN